jgi:hypothetical protein
MHHPTHTYQAQLPGFGFELDHQLHILHLGRQSTCSDGLLHVPDWARHMKLAART